MASDAFGNELNPPASSAEPGKIFEAASKAGLSGEGVLDPNGDGWITSTAAIFSTYPTISDESEEFEESGWVQIFHVSSEPIDDLDTGGACGATEVVDNNHTGQHAGYYRLIDQDSDPSNRNEYLQFRLRMAKEASGAFGYSILIDTDQTFGSSGAASDLNASSGNPGFELEILYGSGGGSAGVTMQDVDGATSGNSTLSFSSPGERDQKSYARFSNCTSVDPIFVDFYVSIGDMPAGITAQTPLRMVFASSSSPNTALGGSASDVGGVDDDQYPADDDAFTIVVESTPLLSFSGGYAAASGTSSIDFGNHVHYFPPLCQDPDSNAVEFQMFYVSTAETEAFDVLIYQGTSGSPVATLSDVSKGNPGTYDPGVFNNGASLVPAEDVGIVLSDAGLRFESAGGEDFYVTYRTRNSLQSGSLTCKGTSALGTEFRWGGIANKAVKENKLSNSAGFMATVDGTVVTVSGYDSDCEFRSGIDPDGIISDTVTFTLDAFETYVLEAIPDEAPANNAGWMGAKIESSEPIAVSTGGLNVGVISGASSRDVGIDQIVPTSRIGTDYVFIRGEGIDDTEFPIIVGVEDGTKVYVGGNLYGTLNDGDYFEIDPSNWSGSTVGSNMFVATDKPAYAFQCLAGYTQNNTIGMNFVTPLTCVPVGGIDEIPLVTDIAGANTYSSAITIISSSSLTSSDLIVSDGGGVVTLPPPTSVAGTTDWVSYFISGLSGNVSALAPAGQISVGIFMSYKHTSGGAVNAGMAGYYSLFNGVSSSYYTDSDGDGVGEGAGLGVYCEGNEPSGSVLNAGPDGCTDTAACNYDDPTGAACSYTQTTFYRDADNDGYGDSSDSQDACSAPTGYVADNTDCDDSDNAANPGISGSCGDNTPPTITSGTTGTDLAENSGAGQTVYTITATDDVAVTSYAIAGTDASLLSVDSSTGVVTLTADPDYEAKSSYSFTVTASDAASNTSTATTVTFSITNVDDAIPTITSGTTGTDLAENSGSGQTVYTITADANDGGTIQSYAIAGTDASLLSVDSSTGVVTLTADPDYEAKSSYSFTVTATDESGTSTATTVTFSITNVDDAIPTITSITTGTDLAENSGSGQTVYTIAADANDGGTIQSYAIAGTDVALLSVNSSTGVVTLTADPDYEAKSSYSFTVTATDESGTSTAATVTFSITNVDDVIPTITSSTTGTDLAENSGSGQTVYTITADANDGGTIQSYAIAGTDVALLSVNSSTGVVTLTADPDYEAKSSYSFTVTATDESGTSTATAVTFSITNVDDAIPTITSGTTGTDLADNSGSGQTVYTIAADANDGGTIQSYAIAGTDASLLSVNSSTGVVTLTADPDYEAKSSYSFTVTATDESGTSTATTVTFSIAVVVVNTLVGCDGGDDLVIDLDTMHTATGVWTYNIDSNLSGFASGSIDGSELTIDFSGAGTDSARIDISGTSGTDSGTFEFLVIESGYPYYTDFQSVGVINPADSVGGNRFTFENGYDVPLTVHYYDNVVWAGLPLGGLSFAPYGDQQEALTDSTGHFVRMPSKDFWIYGYTNTYGCFNPEPATSGTPSASPTLRPVVIPYIIENED